MSGDTGFVKYLVSTLQRAVNFSVDRIWMDLMVAVVAMYLPKKIEPNAQHVVVLVAATWCLYMLQRAITEDESRTQLRALQEQQEQLQLMMQRAKRTSA